jgi:hypothetical protein
MARYFFNTRDGGIDRDDHGQELASPNEARTAAVRFAGEVLRDDPSLVWQGRDFRVEVTDAEGLVLFTLITLGVNSAAFASDP